MDGRWMDARWMDGSMEGWMDGEGTAKRQAQSSGLAAGQWQADRPPLKAFFSLRPAHPLCVTGRVPQSLADRK